MSASITSPRGEAPAAGREQVLARGMLHHGRPLKRWRWVGVFGEEVDACAALVHVGPARQSFWALRRAGGGPLRERTHMLPRGQVQMVAGEGEQGQGLLVVRDAGVFLDLVLEEQPGIQALCAHGEGEVWTRKQAGVPAHGTLSLDGGPPRQVQALAVIDDTAGHHARVTEWRWSAGVGTGADGAPLAWNLVEGVNDPPQGSERAVWVDGVAHEVGPVSFAGDLSALRGQDGSELRFTPVAERSRRERLIVASSDYRAPFGTFAGALPGGIAVASGRGVMEHHRARW